MQRNSDGQRCDKRACVHDGMFNMSGQYEANIIIVVDQTQELGGVVTDNDRQSNKDDWDDD
jgi:hypothetical protein